MTELLAWMGGAPDILLYVALAAGAATENVSPAVPADTFVALGGLLAGVGELDVRWVALWTWLANVVGALVVYRLSYVHGPSFFERGFGRHVLRPHQMQRLRRFYDRWGLPAIFLSRFLPGVRAVVPVFAGATYQPAVRVALPIAVASGVWYGGLVALGVWAGQNLDLLATVLGSVNRWLALAALVVAAVAAAWWIRSRRDPDDD